MVDSKDKGKRGEREAAAKLRELGYDGARRGVQYQGGPDSPDVADAIPGVHIEVKRVERFQLYKALEQAVSEKRQGDVPIVLHRSSRKPWVVVVELDRLLDLAERIHRR